MIQKTIYLTNKKRPTQITKKKNKQKKEEGVPTIELSNKEEEGTTAEKKENVNSRKDLLEKGNTKGRPIRREARRGFTGRSSGHSCIVCSLRLLIHSLGD